MSAVLLHQLHYTSCRAGLSGGTGFQTRTASRGLTLPVRREVEGRSGYQAPRDLPSQPDEEALASFPRPFRYVPLSEGRWLLQLSAYVGQDYSGRWGNFFAHSLVADHALPTWPMDLYEWAEWVTALAAEDDTPNAPSALEPLQLASVPPAASFGPTELQAFLAEDPERPRLLATMLRALFAGRGRRQVMIRDSEVSGLYWIAALHRLLPAEIAGTVSFSTFQFSDRGLADLNVTWGDTDLRLDENDRRYRFYVFDLERGRFSDVEGGPLAYAERVVTWLATAPDELSRFLDFAALFQGLALDPEALLALVELFLLPTASPLPGRARLAALLLLIDRRRPGSEAQLLAHLERGAARYTDAEPALLLVPVLTALAGNDPPSRRKVLERWIRLYDLSVTQDRVHALAREAGLRLRANPTVATELARLFVEDRHLHALAEPLRRANPAARLRVLEDTVHLLFHLGLPPTSNLCVQGWIAQLWEASPRLDTASAMLKLFERAPTEWVGAVGCLFPAPVTAYSLLRRLGEQLASGPPARNAEERRATTRSLRLLLLDRSGAREVLIGEALATVRASGWEAWWEEARAIAPPLPTSPRGEALRGSEELRQMERIRLPVAMARLDELSEVERPIFAASILRNRLFDRGEGEAADLGAVVKLAGRRLALDATLLEEDRFLLHELPRLAQSRPLTLQPDRPVLHTFLSHLDGRAWEKDLASLPVALEQLPAEEYRAFLRRVFERVLRMLPNRDKQESTLEALFLPKESKVFVEIYLEELRGWSVELKGHPAPTWLGSAAHYWCALDANGRIGRGIGDSDLRIMKQLASVILGLSSFKSIREMSFGDYGNQRWLKHVDPSLGLTSRIAKLVQRD